MKMDTVKLLYFLLYVGLSAIAVSLLYWNTQANQNAYLDRMIETVQTEFDAAMESFHLQADNFYYEREGLISEALYSIVAQEAHADDVREYLYDQLVVNYENQKLFGWRQLHIHLPEAISFLRFHVPDHYNDSLASLRYSLRQMNHDHRFRQGYEIGRFYDGFRYIYPLFYSGHFVGSIEWGQSFNSLTTMMSTTFGGDYYFIIDKKLLTQKVSPEYLQQYYRTAPIHGDFSVFQKQEMREPYLKVIETSLQSEPQLSQKLAQELPICKTSIIRGEHYLMVMIPIKEIAGQPAGYLVRMKADTTLQNFANDLLIQVTLVLIILALALFRIYTATQEQQIFRSLLNMQKEMVIMTNGNNMTAANDTLLQFLGYTTFHSFKQDHDCICDLFLEETGYLHREMDHMSWLEYIDLHTNSNHFAKLLNHATNREETFLVQINTLHKGNRYVVSFIDVTSIEDETKELKAQIVTDHLTGLYNRNKFDDLIYLEIKRFKRHRRSLSLVLFDIDHFKLVNDTYGHDVGDIILVELSRCVEQHIRETDYLFRWGGEEFVILQPDTDLKTSQEVTERLRQEIAKQHFTHAIHITCSFGLSTFHPKENADHFFKRADKALYRAKDRGRNRVIANI